MSQYENDNDIKIKQSYLLKINSRNEPQKIKFTKWINAQNNAQNSFLAMINHMVDRFGYTDITDHEVAKKLYTEMLQYGGYEESSSNQHQAPIQSGPSAPVERDSAAIPETGVKKALEQPIKKMNIDPDAF